VKALWLTLMCVLTLTAKASATEPEAFVRATAEEVLLRVEGQKDVLRENPAKLYQLVNEFLVPKFDFQKITRYAMGRHWRATDPKQQARVIEEFQQLLIKTYAKALINYDGQTIEYQPARPGSQPSRVVVSTRVRDSGGPTIPIDYRLERHDDGWRVYDVIIDGVSLVSNYRSTFDSQIRRGGVEGLITELKQLNDDRVEG
jgi:ABC-type transport system involved in resistance to organic solvents, auxiliary component